MSREILNLALVKLKSAVLNYLNSKSQKGEDIHKADVAASFQKRPS